jgi:MarR family 2-MHQ and catechol resistance regulon transcriptional repressor
LTEDTSGVHIWLIMIKAFHALGAVLLRELEGAGIGHSDFRVLEVLLHKGAMPVNTIGPKVLLTPGSISTAVERLHRKGLVSRINCPEDRRVHTVDLTPEGRALISRVFAEHSRLLEDLAGVLAPAEREALVRGLKKLGKNAAQRLIT